ncbi:MAG: hypothetical protein H7Z12_09510 [Rhodospirillaceae bacterium]|nr:hypothetical protein [Rhodospirillales bacterium]
MLKRLFSLGAAGMAALVSGCGDGPATVAGTWRSPAAWSSMIYATSKGPMLIEVHGDPFGLDAAGFRSQLAQVMTNQIMGRATAFTADPEAAPQPRYRVVLAFNAPDTADARHLCEGRIATAIAPSEKVTVLGAFCDGGTLLASVRGWVVKVDGPDDKRFRQLISQVVRDLFGSAS